MSHKKAVVIVIKLRKIQQSLLQATLLLLLLLNILFDLPKKPSKSLGRIQDLVIGVSDKRPPTISNCY